MKLAYATLSALLCVSVSGNPVDCDPSASQTLDGTCNNLLDQTLGAAFTPFRRGSEGAEYEDNVSTPVTSRPGPREISNKVGNEDVSTAGVDPIPHNMMAVMFGQFINHDFENNDMLKLYDLVAETPDVFEQDLLIDDPEDRFCFFPPGVPGIPSRCSPENGPYFVQYRKSAGSIDGVSQQFEVTNRGTSFLDLNTIYGSTEANATVLRTASDGKLATSDYSGTLSLGPFPITYFFEDLPPSRAITGLNTPSLVRASGFGDDEILTAGDERVNNNVALAGFHTLFLREHNYQAMLYKDLHPGANDEEIYQAARRRNIAQYQKIVLEDYLPAEFGNYFTSIAGDYSGYGPTVDPSTGAAFAGAAFRYGHSGIRGYAPLGSCGEFSTFLASLGNELPNVGQVGGPFNILGQLTLAGNEGDFESVMRGLVATRSRPIDTKVDDGIRFITLPGQTRQTLGIDVYSIDIQRGRLNGIPNYDRLREAYHPDGSMYGSPGCGNGLATQENLYGKNNHIDGFVGLLAEAKVPGTSFGETLGRIVVDQYVRARDGDRFWYENVYGTADVSSVKSVSMKTLLERHFDLVGLPEEVFLALTDYQGDLAAS
ncbi:MAG: hypothetical protein SGILL_008924, partial [Bacillariaceae sp.]